MSRPSYALDGAISAREAEVLDALGEHLTNAEISARLFISIRTVESHVSSLLRKLQVADRRALAALSSTITVPAQRTNPDHPVRKTHPAPLTTFVGRAAERAALADALTEHRLVTAVGPGGVGKTRLTLAVLDDVADRYADGIWYVDLVPVTDPARVAPAIADALGLGERQTKSPEETVHDWLSPREALLVLDNCEHLLDGVVVLVERLLRGCPRLTVLATSRARLLAPFERVFLVPGMSVSNADATDSDAVELFLARAAAGGATVHHDDRPRIAALCRHLDGMALAIELAAARLPSLGLDGLEAGLNDPLQLLTGGARIDDRHQSLRSTLDWSYALLNKCDASVLRRVSVFAIPFTADAADAVLAEWPPTESDEVPDVLAMLADQSLLVAMPARDSTRYRVPETIRQYGAEQLDELGERDEAATRHLRWCLEIADALELGDRATFDRVADELRAALHWSSTQSQLRVQAHRLAVRLAELTFARGLPGEAQQRYAEAAALAATDEEQAIAFRYAASAAESRHFGDHAVALHRAAADAYVRAGNKPRACTHVARIAELYRRGVGLMSTIPPPGAADAALAEAWTLAEESPSAMARVMIAEAFRGNAYEPLTAELADRAVVLARRAGDVLAESAAYDVRMSVQLARGELRAALDTAAQRAALLPSLRVSALSGLEWSDALGMAAETALAAGDLAAARNYAERDQTLLFHREESHLANARMLAVNVIAGTLEGADALAEAYRESWERAGRPRAGSLSRGAYAVAAMYGLRGDDGKRAEWLDVVDGISTPGPWLAYIHFGEFFDALLWLHRGRLDAAMRELATPPEHFRDWNNGMWRPWYAALWAEVAVLTQHPDAANRIERAQWVTLDNPIARAIVDRAAALHGRTPESGDRDGLLRAAAAFEAGGCRYQWARTLVFLGGAERLRGEEAFAQMGVTPMAWPPGSG